MLTLMFRMVGEYRLCVIGKNHFLNNVNDPYGGNLKEAELLWIRKGWEIKSLREKVERNCLG